MLKQIKIPNTNLSISSLCLGSARMAGRRNEVDPERLLDTFLDLGGNVYDTARVYDYSEQIIGSWMKNANKREKVIIVTKGGHPEIVDNSKLSIGSRIYRGTRRRLGIPVMPRIRNTYKEMRLDLEESLRNLQTDYIDIYLYHRDDETIPVDQLIENMEQFVKDGKIRYYGCSNWSVKRIEEANIYCKKKGYRGFVTNQALYNIGTQGMKRMIDPTMKKMDVPMIDYHKNHIDMISMAYSSACGGFFHKLHANDNVNLKKSEYYSDSNVACLDQIKLLMKKYGATLTQVELGFLITQEFCCIPLYAPRNVNDLIEAVQAFEIPFALADYQSKRL